MSSEKRPQETEGEVEVYCYLLTEGGITGNWASERSSILKEPLYPKAVPCE